MPTTPLPLSRCARWGRLQPAATVVRRYDSVTRAVEEYLWHEFGDTMLLLPR